MHFRSSATPSSERQASAHEVQAWAHSAAAGQVGEHLSIDVAGLR